MTTGKGGKPPTGPVGPVRPAAETPQRMIVRPLEHSTSDAGAMGAGDTAVAVAAKENGHTAGTDLPDPGALGRLDTDAIPQLSRPDIVGTTLSGRYLVTRKIGQGGMGAVYEATHTLIGKQVAIKVLLEKYARREAIIQRLEQEARLASSVRNEHIIDVTDFGTTEDGRTFVVMEYLEGESLAECLARESRLPEQRILRIASQAASALAAAHAKGVVHRDIKPENLFLLRRNDLDFVKVVDFGISKSLRASDENEEQVRLTQTGMVLGTPLYMSPEQARGDDELDARVDIYALGVIMFETATGRVPFLGNNYLSVISQVLNEDAPSLRELRPDLTEEFEAVVLRAMAKNRADRYASATDMLADITALLDDPTHSTERARITGPRRLARSLARPGSQKKSPLKVAVWIALIAIIVAATVVTVTLTMHGGDGKPGTGSNAAVVPPMDAAGPQPAIDAAVVPVPATETVAVTIESDPPGALVFLDGVEKDVTPMTLKLVKKNKEIQGIATLAGFDDHEFAFNPLEFDDKPIHIKLHKPAKGVPIQHKTITPPTDKGSATHPGSKTGGELSGYPGAKS